MILTKDQILEFDRTAMPMIRFLCDNFNPHVRVIITPTGASISEEAYFTGPILDFIKD